MILTRKILEPWNYYSPFLAIKEFDTRLFLAPLLCCLISVYSWLYQYLGQFYKCIGYRWLCKSWLRCTALALTVSAVSRYTCNITSHRYCDVLRDTVYTLWCNMLHRQQLRSPRPGCCKIYKLWQFFFLTRTLNTNWTTVTQLLSASSPYTIFVTFFYVISWFVIRGITIILTSIESNLPMQQFVKIAINATAVKLASSL